MKNTFDALSSSYDAVLTRDLWISGEKAAYFARYKAERVQKTLGNHFKGRVLDYGCGIGAVAKSLRSFSGMERAEIYGYDVSQESINVCRNNVRNVNFLTDLDDSFQGFFDVIILSNVFHHVHPEKRDDLLQSVLKLLKENAYLFIFEHNPLNPLTQWVVKTSPIDKNASLVGAWRMKCLLRRNGVVDFCFRFMVFFPSIFRMFRFLEPFLGFLPMGAQYMCVARISRKPHLLQNTRVPGGEVKQ